MHSKAVRVHYCRIKIRPYLTPLILCSPNTKGLFTWYKVSPPCAHKPKTPLLCITLTSNTANVDQKEWVSISFKSAPLAVSPQRFVPHSDLNLTSCIYTDGSGYSINRVWKGPVITILNSRINLFLFSFFPSFVKVS